MTISFLGTGEMGAALARATLKAGIPTTVWNRTPAKSEALADRATGHGVTVVATVQQALTADLVVVCLFDHASVHEVLDPVAEHLDGTSILNLTTTSPDGARELADWALRHRVDYLDGGIMATPEMIGTPASRILYSGSEDLYQRHRQLLEIWGSTEYFGPDAGMASLYDLALLSTMYVTFAGFFHGAAMVGPAGVSATEFAARTADWLAAILPSLSVYAGIIDARDYAGPGQQSLEFSDLSDIVDASRAQGISTELVDVVQRWIHRQIDAGHGSDGFARAFESVRQAVA